MFSTSHIELSRDALKHNLSFLKRMLGKETRLAIVLKANAYGHGIEPFLKLAEGLGVRHFTTFSAREAQAALNARSKDSVIQIMGDLQDDAMAWAIQKGIAFHVFSLSRIERTLKIARDCARPAHIHLELETGMNRVGVPFKDLADVLAIIRRERELLRLEGTCTHLAGAESIVNHVRVTSQLEEFHRLCNCLAEAGIAPGLRHVSSSSGIFTYPESRLDMVRAGIISYGFWPTPEVRMRYLMDKTLNPKQSSYDPLRRVMSWKSHVMAVKSVEAGEFIGYGSSFLTTHKRRIAIIPVGYSEGFPRSLSNSGRVLIAGRRCQVVGTVNMNMISVDVSGITGVKAGDEAVLIGKQKRKSISVASFSEMANDLNYEVLARLSEEIPRVVVE